MTDLRSKVGFEPRHEPKSVSKTSGGAAGFAARRNQSGPVYTMDQVSLWCKALEKGSIDNSPTLSALVHPSLLADRRIG